LISYMLRVMQASVDLNNAMLITTIREHFKLYFCAETSING
jgi:hypothetical protein